MRVAWFLLFLFTTISNSQEIEIGSKFTIEFKNTERKKHFTIAVTEKYYGIIELSKTDSVVSANPPKANQIIGIFTTGKFGDKKMPALLLISGLKDDIGYDLKIKTPRDKKFKKTSTAVLIKDIKSIENWQYEIEKIKFTGFQTIPAEEQTTQLFKEEIDSVCIKNPGMNIAVAEQEFKVNFKSILEKLQGNDEIKLQPILDYEKSISSEDTSLGHNWSLGTSTYPNSKHFIFEFPISFRRRECPYFNSDVSYFYTRKSHYVKMCYFEWETFRESNFGINPSIQKDVTDKYNEKFEFLIKSISELMGEPLNIEQKENSATIQKRWLYNGINVCLYRFIHYNNIRLCIYKE